MKVQRKHCGQTNDFLKPLMMGGDNFSKPSTLIVKVLSTSSDSVRDKG